MTQWPIAEATGIDVQLVAKLTKENGEDISNGENPFKLILQQKKQVAKTAQLVGRDGLRKAVGSPGNAARCSRDRELDALQ